MRQLLALLALLCMPAVAAASTACPWPAWERFKIQMVSADGRVLDRSDERLVTTSEGPVSYTHLTLPTID